MSKANADAAYHTAAAKLNQHLKKCARCKGAISAGDSAGMCDTGIFMSCTVAKRFTSAVNSKWWRGFSKTDHKYVCPDPDAHGKAFLYTATPVTVTSEQPEMF